ncbi:MAG: hypothetical protein M9947_02235 [Thermomicrobiales bacterium]|nr:hypothetical protein [Thermomicrobiales bacterium]
MIRFLDKPSNDDAVLVTVAAGKNLDDALMQFGTMPDCIGCSVTVATPGWTPEGTVERIWATFSPLAPLEAEVRPISSATGLVRRGGWTEVDIDARAQRLKKVRMPANLVGAQRLVALNDVRSLSGLRPVIAIGMWALFAHPIVRTGARLASVRDGLTAEIALAVHPDRYVLLDSDARHGLTYVVSTPDIIAADLMVLALRQHRARFRGAGPWEDALVQASTELGLGVRNSEHIDIEALVSPTLSPEQAEHASTSLVSMAELIGVQADR